MRSLARAGGGARGRSPCREAQWIPPSALAAALALGVAACAAAPPDTPETSVLLSSPESFSAAEDAAGAREPAARAGPIALPFRAPGPDGAAYRLLLEMSGERNLALSTDLDERRPLHESHLLELEYRELPVESAGAAEPAYSLSLDALHYVLLQKNPDAEREIELADDRLRVSADGKVEIDLRGSQPKEGLTPRKLLGRVFALLVHDNAGNPLRIQPRGVPVARRFLGGLHVLPAIGYSRLALAEGEISPGATWRARRFPASPAGEIGLWLDVEYALAGFRELDGARCAWIVFRAEQDAEDVPSAAGFRFERVVASLAGEAWVELETSRLRRLALEDEIRAAYSRGGDPGPVASHRLRHKTRLLLALRDRDASPSTWEDGSPRFGRR